jgi:hypothetical protein
MHIAQSVERSEDNHKRIVQYIVHRLFIAEITPTYAPHLLGVCFIQFAEGVRISLPASFYQPCFLHR